MAYFSQKVRAGENHIVPQGGEAQAKPSLLIGIHRKSKQKQDK